MIENNPILSICIPTYNRENSIKQTLEKLCAIVNNKDIEIVISDNCSTDNTKSICNFFSNKFDNIVYYCQKENIGPDKNFEFVLTHAKGKYRWLLGDGLFIDKINLSLLLNYVVSEDVDLIVLGEKERNSSDKEKIYYDGNELLKEIGWHLTWISVLVFNERVINNSDFKRYYESNFIQTGIIFEYFSINKGVVHFIPNICISNLYIKKTNGWQSKVLEIFCQKWFLFVFSLPLFYTYESKKVCVYSHGIKTKLFSIRGLIRLKLQGGISLKSIRENWFFIKNSITKKSCFFMLIISLVPCFILRFLLRIKKCINV